MSELKAVLAFDVYEAYTKTGDDDAAQVYLKYEADNVISTIRAERDEYRYNLSCARNEIHNLSMSMREDVKRIADKEKVIAELQEKLKVQTSIAEEGWKEFRTYHTSYAEAVKELYEKNKELRYQKYRRCLAMARWCEAEMWNIRNTPLCDMNTHEVWQHDDEFWQRWYERWLELAERFK